MANSEFDFEIEGLSTFIEEIKQMDSRAEDIIIDELSKFGLTVEEGARALVQHDHGELEHSINFDRAVKEGNDYVVHGGSNSEYALRRHEEPYRMGVYDKYEEGRKDPDFYINGRGRKTHRKPSWRGYKPGRKYLDNAVKALEPDWDTINDRILKRILEG